MRVLLLSLCLQNNSTSRGFLVIALSKLKNHGTNRTEIIERLQCAFVMNMVPEIFYFIYLEENAVS